MPTCARHLLQADVRLEEAVEEDEPLRPSRLDPRSEVGERGEVRRELHRDRELDRRADRLDHLDVAPLDLGAGDRGSASTA